MELLGGGGGALGLALFIQVCGTFGGGALGLALFIQVCGTFGGLGMSVDIQKRDHYSLAGSSCPSLCPQPIRYLAPFVNKYGR